MIWTPRFTISFAFLLVLGLSGATLLTNGMLNGYYAPALILLVWALACCAWWLAALMYPRGDAVKDERGMLLPPGKPKRSMDFALGSVAGLLCGLLGALAALLALVPSVSLSPIPLFTATAAICALSACYVCFSVARAPWRRWDQLFFLCAPLVLILITAVAFWLTPDTLRSWSRLASIVMAVLLVFCMAVWWLRPSCWRTQPGPTFLCGLVPLFLLSQVLPNGIGSEAGFFFAQVVCLCFMLAAFRLLRCELSH